jgi:apolipoprotein N-acyltransferase
LLEAGDLRIGAFICWEAMYPELVREFALAGAEVLANLSNDAWFGDAAPARLHLDTAALRAIENRRYLLRATATGLSAVIDPYGRTVTESRLREAEVLSATIRPSGAHTPYQRWGDAVALAALALALAVALVDAASSRLPVRRPVG